MAVGKSPAAVGKSSSSRRREKSSVMVGKSPVGRKSPAAVGKSPALQP